MTDPTLDADLPAYLAQPVQGEHLPATFQLSPILVGLLHRLAALRGAGVDPYVEHLLFKALKAEHARLLVEAPLDPVPAAFSSVAVAQARVDLTAQVAANKAHEERGDKATRIAAQMEAVLADTQGADAELDAVRRKAAVGEAMLDEALAKRSAPDQG